MSPKNIYYLGNVKVNKELPNLLFNFYFINLWDIETLVPVFWRIELVAAPSLCNGSFLLSPKVSPQCFERKNCDKTLYMGI